VLKYEHNRGMNWCLFHEDENCVECTAKICVHANQGYSARETFIIINRNRQRRCEQLDDSNECYDCGDDVCLA
jgi:hypothetical protein